MRSLIARLYLFVPLTALMLCQLGWVYLLGNVRDVRLIVPALALLALLTAGTILHLRRR